VADVRAARDSTALKAVLDALRIPSFKM